MPSKKTSSQQPQPGPSQAAREKSVPNSLTSNNTLTGEQIQEYKEVFQEIDTDGEGSISLDEFALAIKSLGYDFEEEYLQRIVADADTDGNGSIDFEEFITLIQTLVRPSNSEELIYEAFKFIGGDGSGAITLDALRDKSTELGLNFTDQDLQDMIEEAQPDDNGKVSYQGLIQFMSDGNETLLEAYKRRTTHEEQQQERREEQRRREEEKMREEGEREERVPDIDEIASQFEQSNYDEYSRQPNGRRVLKKPGKKVQMSRTRMQYLKRKAEAQGLDIDEYMEVREFQEAEGRAAGRSSSSKDVWMGSINDDRVYDTSFKSNPPRAYKHVESRLHNANSRQTKHPNGTQRDKSTDKKQKLVLQASVVTDFDKELKKIQKSREGRQPTKTGQSTNMFPMKPKKLVPNAEKIDFKALDGYTARKKVKEDYNMNYGMWRMFFEKAVKQIKEAKHKIDHIESALKEVQSEKKQNKQINYTTSFAKKRQNLRPNVITPTLESPSLNQVKIETPRASTERKPSSQPNSISSMLKTRPNGIVYPNKNKNAGGSYVNKFKEARGIPVVMDSTDEFSVGSQESKKSWRSPKRSVPVISKDKLDLFY